MASSYTTNYQLCQWAASDKVLRTEFNEDNAKIDAAIQAVDSRAASGLSGKADQSALNSLSSTVAAQGTALNLRNCRFVTGSYTGAGTCGEANPNVLTFSHKPVFFCVTSSSDVRSIFAVRGQTATAYLTPNVYTWLALTWGERSVSWYMTNTGSKVTDEGQLNDTITYHYFAILEL